VAVDAAVRDDLDVAIGQQQVDEDAAILFAMYGLDNMGKDSVRVNDGTLRLEIDRFRTPMAYPEAAELARQSARSDSENFLRRKPFRTQGTAVEESADNR